MEDLEKVIGLQDGDIAHDRGFPAIIRGNDHGSYVLLAGKHGHGEYPAHRLDELVQRKLSCYQVITQGFRFDLPIAARIPTAMGRSNDDPSFLVSAGARFAVILSP